MFDCIEFNQEFRCIDVIYDAAFMVMDLEFRSRRDLAFGFFNAWIEHSGDYEGAAMLAFYAGLRASVRAKVKSFLLNDLICLKRKIRASRSKQQDFIN